MNSVILPVVLSHQFWMTVQTSPIVLVVRQNALNVGIVLACTCLVLPHLLFCGPLLGGDLLGWPLVQHCEVGTWARRTRLVQTVCSLSIILTRPALLAIGHALWIVTRRQSLSVLPKSGEVRCLSGRHRLDLLGCDLGVASCVGLDPRFVSVQCVEHLSRGRGPFNRIL